MKTFTFFRQDYNGETIINVFRIKRNVPETIGRFIFKDNSILYREIMAFLYGHSEITKREYSEQCGNYMAKYNKRIRIVEQKRMATK